MANILSFAVYAFCEIIVLLICVEAIMSWFVMYFSPGLRRIYGFIYNLIEPFMMPFRQLLRPFSMRIGIDFSPVVAVLIIQMAARLLSHLFYVIF